MKRGGYKYGTPLAGDSKQSLQLVDCTHLRLQHTSPWTVSCCRWNCHERSERSALSLYHVNSSFPERYPRSHILSCQEKGSCYATWLQCVLPEYCKGCCAGGKRMMRVLFLHATTRLHTSSLRSSAFAKASDCTAATAAATAAAAASAGVGFRDTGLLALERRHFFFLRLSPRE